MQLKPALLCPPPAVQQSFLTLRHGHKCLLDFLLIGSCAADGEDASVVPDLLALNAPRVIISGGQFALLSEISLVCSQIAEGMQSGATLYRQGLVSGVFAWTIDDAACWAALKKAGATAILTNYPTSSWVQ